MRGRGRCFKSVIYQGILKAKRAQSLRGHVGMPILIRKRNLHEDLGREFLLHLQEEFVDHRSKLGLSMSVNKGMR